MGHGAGERGNSSVSPCGLGPGWFIIPRSPTEVQPRGEQQPWVSLTQAESLSRRGRAAGEGGCRGGSVEGSACVIRLGGVEERAGMSGRTWAANAALPASAAAERTSEAHPRHGQ